LEQPPPFILTDQFVEQFSTLPPAVHAGRTHGSHQDTLFGNCLHVDAFPGKTNEITRGSLAPVDAGGKSLYSYFNATVGLLTALIMTGNFMH